MENRALDSESGTELYFQGFSMGFSRELSRLLEQSHELLTTSQRQDVIEKALALYATELRREIAFLIVGSPSMERRGFDAGLANGRNWASARFQESGLFYDSLTRTIALFGEPEST